jgi:hypothetical protein
MRWSTLTEEGTINLIKNDYNTNACAIESGDADAAEGALFRATQSGMGDFLTPCIILRI